MAVQVHPAVFRHHNKSNHTAAPTGVPAEGGPGKQVTTTGVGPGNISRWNLIFFQKFEFEKRGYFGPMCKETTPK